MVGFDDVLFGGRWWQDGSDGHPGAEGTSRMNIVAESERDLQRQRERDAEPVAPMRWRFHDGAWQRWSELDRAFAPMPPPGTLLEHASAVGGPVEDEELVFDGDSWEPAGDLAEEAAAAEPPPARDGERQAADFEAQLEAWRRRR